MKSFVTHLEAAIDGTRLPADQLQTMHRDRPLWVRYDLDAVRRAVAKADLRDRPATMWRLRELLPVPFDAPLVTLGEGRTPLLPCPRLAEACGVRQLWIKDESQLPTGSFKSRGMAMAITMAKHLGVQHVALPTAGNAGGAAAAYAARAGMACDVFMPEDTPVVNQYECHLAGARTTLVAGLINDCGRIVREGKATRGWFDLSTLKEPYRIEGKKTMGLELAEQFDWKLPDAILYPTGGGTGLIGMWKAFSELAALGWLADAEVPVAPAAGEPPVDGPVTGLPRMISVQSEGCAPISKAYAEGRRFAELFPQAQTLASGIRVPVAVGDFMILDAVRASGGCALSVEEAKLREWMYEAASLEGIAICPEAAACVGALKRLVREGRLDPAGRIVIFNTGAAQKYVEALAATLPRVGKDYVA
ncbi:MAG: threonine synthase [Pirellulales bacterium]